MIPAAFFLVVAFSALWYGAHAAHHHEPARAWVNVHLRKLHRDGTEHDWRWAETARVWTCLTCPAMKASRR